MKKHDILFQAQEEALIQALEEEMARETPDPDAIRAILDQLDRQTGGAAFDPEAGWRELQTRRPAKRRRLGRYPVVLAAVLVCLAVAGTALAVNLGLHEKLAALFPADEETQALVSAATDTPVCTVTQDGVTITVTQTVADTAGIYVIYEVTLPERVTLPADAVPSEGLLLPTLDIPQGSQHQRAGGGAHEILTQTPHQWTGLVTVEGLSAPVSPGPVRLFFADFGYDTADGEHVSLVNEPILLQWTLKQSNQTVHNAPHQTIKVDGVAVYLSDLSLTPLSFSIFSTGQATDSMPVALKRRDGTQLPLNTQTCVKNVLFTGDAQAGTLRTHYHYRFHTPIDPSTVEAVILGTTEIPF